MSDQQVQPSVTDESGAVPMQPEQGAAQSEDSNALRQKMALMHQDLLAKGESNKTLRGEIDQLRSQLSDVQKTQRKAQDARHVEEGNFESLWEQTKQTVAEREQTISALEQKLSQAESDKKAQSIKTQAVQAFRQAGVQQPEHLFALNQDRFRRNGDSLVVLDGGVETSMERFVDSAKQPGSNFEYMFQGSNARGMGAVGSTPGGSGGVTENPYSTGNFSLAVKLEGGSPEEQALAARFKAQAGKT